MDGLSAKITVTNNKLPFLEKAIQEAVRKAVKETTEEAAEIARSLAPVDTGVLKESITTEAQGNQYAATGIIHVGAPYGIYQELGTRYMAPQPFIAPAIDAVSQSYQDRIARCLDEAVKNCPSTSGEVG